MRRKPTANLALIVRNMASVRPFLELVADAEHGRDQFGRVELLAQPLNMGVDRARIAGEIVAPDEVEPFGARENPAPIDRPVRRPSRPAVRPRRRRRRGTGRHLPYRPVPSGWLAPAAEARYGRGRRLPASQSSSSKFGRNRSSSRKPSEPLPAVLVSKPSLPSPYASRSAIASSSSMMRILVFSILLSHPLP